MTVEQQQAPANGEIVESTAVDVGRELIPAAAPPAPVLAVTPTVKASELVERLSVIREAMETAMQPDVDYGAIAGTGGKPTLLKPGAEKLAVLFQLDVQLHNEKIWGPDGHLTVISHATVFHAPSGARLGYGEGICSTREKKYGKRQQSRRCPNCEKETIIKGRAEYGGGWLCFAKKGGCGAKFPDDASQIVGQEVGEIDNPDLADAYNTVDKMASKRARVDAVLSVTGASALFTQDVEDLPAGDNDGGAAKQPAPPAPPAVEFVTAEDIAALQEVAAGLSGQQIKLAMGAVGVPIPDPFVWNRVPKDKAAALAKVLAGTERPS